MRSVEQASTRCSSTRGPPAQHVRLRHRSKQRPRGRRQGAGEDGEPSRGRQGAPQPRATCCRACSIMRVARAGAMARCLPAFFSQTFLNCGNMAWAIGTQASTREQVSGGSRHRSAPRRGRHNSGTKKITHTNARSGNAAASKRKEASDDAPWLDVEGQCQAPFLSPRAVWSVNPRDGNSRNNAYL